MKKDFFIDLGSRLQEVRRLLGIQQKDMAKEVGFNPGYLSELENGGKSNPGIAILYKISEHYKVSLDYLVHGRGEMFWQDKEDSDKRRKILYPVLETIEDVTCLMKSSRYARNSIIAYALKFFIENQEVLKKEILLADENEMGRDDDGGEISSKG